MGKNRSYIYDHAEVNAAFYSDQTNPQAPNAAIWVHSPDHEIVFVFELQDGWVREEMSLFLNTVRMSLNYRLFSDIMGGRLEQAVQIQKSLLPQKAPEIPGYQIIGCSRPAEIVGGDFYDYFELDEGLFGVSLGDASGHGIPAALLVRDVVTGLRMGLAKEMRMVHTIKKLNHVIQRSTYSTSFVSVFVGEIEWDGHLFYCNAGHPGPFLVHKNRAQNLSATGITLGFMPEIELHRAYAKMERNSVLVIYSDGIFERRNEEGEQFGLERLQELVMNNQNKRAEGILEIVFNTVYDFGNRTNWEDDATVVVIKRL